MTLTVQSFNQLLVARPLLVFPLLLFLFEAAAQTKSSHNPSFQVQAVDNDIQIGYGLEIGDVDGDGKADILLADKKQIVWYRNGDWQRFVMVDNLTERDNVCLAARDINGDGQVEVAVGAQWNPGETSDASNSGSVHFLIRPQDPTQLWQPVKLHHEPTVHRMRWIQTGNNYQLVVLPLHGKGNKGGDGEGVKVIAYQKPADPKTVWDYETIDQSMHLTHNLDVIIQNGSEALLVGGKEGAKVISFNRERWETTEASDWLIADHGFGEIRKSGDFIAGVQPLHGSQLVLYNTTGERKVISDSLNQGHALAFGDLLSQGQDQIVVGWRNENNQQQIGIKIFVADDPQWNNWQSHWVDKNGMACEDLKVADLDGDGKLDIVAAGRSTKNLKIYWNRNK